MRDYVLDGTRRHAKFCSDRFRGYCSPNSGFCRTFGVTSFKATAYTLERIFTQNTSEDVVPGKEVPSGGLDVSITIFDIYTLKFPKNRHFGDRF